MEVSEFGVKVSLSWILATKAHLHIWCESTCYTRTHWLRRKHCYFTLRTPRKMVECKLCLLVFINKQDIYNVNMYAWTARHKSPKLCGLKHLSWQKTTYFYCEGVSVELWLADMLRHSTYNIMNSILYRKLTRGHMHVHQQCKGYVVLPSVWGTVDQQALLSIGQHEHRAFSTASFWCTSCYFWLSDWLTRVAFCRVHQKMDWLLRF